MDTLPTEQLASWIATGEVLVADGRGPKVVRCRDGLLLKILRPRRHIALARLFPAAGRFTRNAECLLRLGFPAPHVREAFWLDRPHGLSGCRYEPLAGQSLEELLAEHPERLAALIPALARFILQLHARHIYFRSLHPGNILLLESGGFGLIDLLDLHLKPLPLSAWHIRRNFRHLEQALQRRQLAHFPLDALRSEYERLRRL